MLDLHPDASEEVETAYARYEALQQGLGDYFFEALDHAFSVIQDMPKAWPVSVEGIRKYVMRRFPFNVLYMLDDGFVLVIAVMHQSRKPGYWKGRL